MLALILTLIIFALALKEKYNFMILSLLLLVICTSLYKFGTKEEFSNYAPLDYGIGEYSNLNLTPEGHSDWRHPPSDVPLLNKINEVSQGNQLPVDNDPQLYQFDNIDAPSVDGDKKSPKSLFMFSNNQCRPECCPSTYSCDKGCVCTTEQQRKFINNRGVMKSSPHEI